MENSADYPVGLLLRHLDAQRDSALQLITRHNQFLANVLGHSLPTPGNATSSPPLRAASHGSATAPARAVASQTKGNIVLLFDYVTPSQDSQATVPDATSPSTEYLVFDENDRQARLQYGKDIDALLASHGADDALAVNRKYMAGTIFLTEARNGLFYMRSHSGVLFVVCFVGADDQYPGVLSELVCYAQENELQINIMAHEGRVNDLKDNGFSTTPIGIWQRIETLSEFTLAGKKMRRLRYLVSKYTKGCNCKTTEYVPGAVAETDEAICKVIDQWVALKGQNIPFAADVKDQVRKGEFGSDHRFFLTYRDDALENVIVFSRDNYNNGYLMDLEFYAEGMPLGSTEYALTEIIDIFAKEDRKVVSLGLTMGTELFEHENSSKDVYTLFEQLKKADYLNGDANAQYKNKYRPTTTTMYLARPRGCGKKKLNDLLLLLGTG